MATAISRPPKASSIASNDKTSAPLSLQSSIVEQFLSRCFHGPKNSFTKSSYKGLTLYQYRENKQLFTKIQKEESMRKKFNLLAIGVGLLLTVILTSCQVLMTETPVENAVETLVQQTLASNPTSTAEGQENGEETQPSLCAIFALTILRTDKI